MTELEEIRALVDTQAEDEGLWFVAETGPEAYLQHHLRILHSLVEHYTTASEEHSALARQETK